LTYRQILCLVAALLFLASMTISAGDVSTDELSADDIVALINAVPDGEQVTRKLSMELIDRRGKTRLRETISYRKYFGDEKRTAIFFLSPANVRDTAFLTWDYADPEQDDDQWLYLPALGKVRRVSAADRGDYFLGTDFTYEDLKLEGKVSASDYSYNYLPDTTPQTGGSVRLEALPVSENVAEELGYSKTVLTVDPANWVVTEVEFWDTKGRPLKNLVATDIRQVGGIWTRHSLVMKNHQTGHTTRLTFSDVDYSGVLEDEVFSKQALSRGR
jgi:hypothetical protein